MSGVERWIADLCGDDIASRQRARRALLDSDDPRVVPALVRQLSHADPLVRITLVALLGQFNDQAAVLPLVALLDGDEDVGVRAAVAEALGELTGDEARRALEYALLNDAEPSVRAAAATALGMIGSPRSTDTLLRALTERHSAVWHAAGEALWQLGSEAMDHIVNGLLDSEHEMRKASLRAVLWLSVDADEEDMTSLDDPGWLETWGWLN